MASIPTLARAGVGDDCESDVPTQITKRVPRFASISKGDFGMSELASVAPQVVQENVTPRGTPMERYTKADEARGTASITIPFVLATASKIILEPRDDGSGRQWRNEVADVIEKDPNSERVYVQKAVRLNWSEVRGTDYSDLPANIAGLDVVAETGEVLEVDALLHLVKAFRKAASGAPATADTAGAVMED